MREHLGVEIEPRDASILCHLLPRSAARRGRIKRVFRYCPDILTTAGNDVGFLSISSRSVWWRREHYIFHPIPLHLSHEHMHTLQNKKRAQTVWFVTRPRPQPRPRHTEADRSCVAHPAAEQDTPEEIPPPPPPCPIIFGALG